MNGQAGKPGAGDGGFEAGACRHAHVASLIDHMAMANGASHRPRRANSAQWAALVALEGAARF